MAPMQEVELSSLQVENADLRRRLADAQAMMARFQIDGSVDDALALPTRSFFLGGHASGQARQRDAEMARQSRQAAFDVSALACTWDWDVKRGRIYADPRFAHLFRIEPAAAISGFSIADYASGVHPEDRPATMVRIDEAVVTGGLFAAEFRTVDVDGRVRHVRAEGRCLRDERGRPDRFPGVLVDVTLERARLTQQAALLQISDDVLTGTEDLDHAAHMAEILGRTLGLCRAGYVRVSPDGLLASVIAQWTSTGVAPLAEHLARQRYGEQLVVATASGRVVIDDIATHALTRDNLEPWTQDGIRSFAIMPALDPSLQRATLFLHDSRPRAWSAEELAFVDEALQRSWRFAERQRVQQARLNAETRLRLAQEAANIGTFDHDLATRTLLWDRRCRTAFGVLDEQSVSFRRTFLPTLHPEDRSAALGAIARALDLSGTGTYDAVFRTIGRDDGLLRWVHANGQVIVQNGVAVRFVGAVRDISREQEDEERQKFLARELQHRVKNTLAMVNALANQTLRRAPSAQAGLAIFTDRLIALSRANELLVQTSWHDADIINIVCDSLRALQPEEGGRVTWTGPPVRLSAKQSLALGLALHELSTNAVKYGALSNDEGRISIGWTVTTGPEGSHLWLEWRESDGPRVTAPRAFGFGSRLIEKTLALEFGGKVSLSYHETGVVCVVEAPLRPQAVPA
ncbi:PAS domain-containing protein [Aureimonas glaciei]|nr:PAS domain-containing protein [Aureimonas glaciei]